jgi:hypothetical protein
MPETPFNHGENPLPFGGVTDISGKVIWAMTEEEEEEMVRKIKKAFGG